MVKEGWNLEPLTLNHLHNAANYAITHFTTSKLGVLLPSFVPLFLSLLAFLATPFQRPPDVIWFNGVVVTLDAQKTIAQAIAIRDGAIVNVGVNATILALAGPNTLRRNLAGRTVVPGLADNHYHSIGGGPGVDLSRARSLQDVVDAIARRAAQTPAGEVILTNSDWHEGQLKEKRLPYRDDLDHATTDHPVVVVRGGHEYILNSAGLKRWNIVQQVAAPTGGEIGRYPDGRLNGELVDQARTPVALPKPAAIPIEKQLDDLEAEYSRLNAGGLTAIRYAGAPPELYRNIQALERSGRLTIRVSFLFRIPPTARPEELDRIIAAWGAAQDEGDDWLRVWGTKLVIDGGYEGGWMREPYEEPWGKGGTYRGLQTMPPDAYTGIVIGLSQRSWRVATHAVGDSAIGFVLDAYGKANSRRSITDRRWSIEHGFLPRADHFPIMRSLGVVVTAQNHLYVAGPSLLGYWGKTRAEHVTPLKSYLDEHIPVSLGTDSPVNPFSPFWTLYHFITRDTINASVLGADQRINRLEALRLATQGYAYLTFEDGHKGSIEPGRLADMVVLSGNFLTCPEKDIEAMTATATMVGGKLVYHSETKNH